MKQQYNTGLNFIVHTINDKNLLIERDQHGAHGRATAPLAPVQVREGTGEGRLGVSIRQEASHICQSC